MGRLGLLVAGAIFGVVLVANCSAPGSMLEDMGELIGLDLSTKDADAAPGMTAACDKHWDIGAGPTRSEYYYAEFAVAGFNPKAPEHMTAMVCDYQPVVGSAMPYFVCPASVGGCTVGLDGNCRSAEIVSARDGVIRVGCGAQQFSNGNVTLVQRFTTAHLKVGP
jgi:hypothetical protein